MPDQGIGSVVSLSTIASGLAIYWVLATLYHFLVAPTPPTTIPWLGYGKGWLASLCNYFALTKSKDWVFAGYEKYSKDNKSFVMPPILGMPAEVVLPRSQMSWMFDQPDSVLSTIEAHYDLLQGAYTFVEPFIMEDPYHEHVVHRSIVRNLNTIVPGLEQEVPDAIEKTYGTDTDRYIKVDVLDSFMKMIPSLTNRMLVGPSLCREQKYLDAVYSFTVDVVRTQVVMILMPKAIHPVVGRLMGLAAKYHYWVASKYTLPLIRERIGQIQKEEAGHPDYKDWKAPNDFITWSYRSAQADGKQEEAQPERIAKRIMPLNFASIHTTALTAYDTLINILCADVSVVESLREEAYRVLQEEGGWTKQGLSRMHRMDSAIRESQRVTPIALTLNQRKVIAKDGVPTPEGVQLKYGTYVSCPWAPLALDEDIHDQPTTFDAFRYSRARDEYDAMTPEQKEKTDTLKLKQTGLVTTAHHHLPFGHGRHACPGRFFVSHELKMIFGHLLLNYEFKPLEERPERFWAVRIQVPLPAKVEVKRRATPWQGLG